MNRAECDGGDDEDDGEDDDGGGEDDVEDDVCVSRPSLVSRGGCSIVPAPNPTSSRSPFGLKNIFGPAETSRR